MISLETKTESTVSLPLGHNTSEDGEKPTISFSELLRGVKDTKDVENNAVILALDKKSTDIIAPSILAQVEHSFIREGIGSIEAMVDHPDTLNKASMSKEGVLSIEQMLINPDVLALPLQELKLTIVQAKAYLKDKILKSDAYKFSEIKELPKTLKGLTQIAQKFNLNLSKITLEDVAPKSDIKQEIRKDFKNIEGDEKVELKINKSKNIQNLDEQHLKDTMHFNDKKVQVLKELKAIPLFKVESKQELMTQQVVLTKQNILDIKAPKSRADETLKLLLRGEKPNQVSQNATVDFSVATARVIATSTKTEANKSLEQLLHGNPEDSTSKTDGLSTHKADSFEVKLNEAKQMIKYLSQDVKTAIEDYKSPFTRVKVQLNPAKMGEIDITIVSRGKNLHLNISSNTAAINTLAMNVNELKTQLSTSGINNATLNFSNSSQQNEQHSSRQEQNSQSREDANEEYNYFESEEKNEELLHSLEIVVPNYA